MEKTKIKKFNNKSNKSFIYENETYWYNRASAVTVNVLCYYQDSFYYLVGRRGDSDVEPYKHNIIGGYIDWNETLKEASLRELYEESGLDLDDIKYKDIIADNLDQPIYTYTDINTNNQNIIFVTEFIFKSEKLPELTIEYAENNEVFDVYWIKLEDISTIDDWAFKHKEISDMIVSNIKYKYKSLLK